MKEREPIEEKILVTNIQRFSLHDGPGIRTTVFLKGCSLHCPWCCNPENISGNIEQGWDNSKAITFGTYMSVTDLYNEVIKDEIFFDGGGVTFSGGEALLQMPRIEPLLRQFKEKNIHLCVETALFVPFEYLRMAVQYFDLFFVDIKIMDVLQCQQILGGDIRQYCYNMSYLRDCGCEFIVRMPIISEFTNSDDNIKEIATFLKHMNIDTIEILQEHQMGAKKYEILGRKLLDTVGIAMEEMERCKALFLQYGVKAEILAL